MFHRTSFQLIFIFLLALLISLSFTFLIYPKIFDQLSIPLDIDKHGSLGLGLYYNGTISYFPNTDPTISRGPFYPLLIAAGLTVTQGWYPGVVQILQCILFGCTCLLMYYLGNTLWGRPYGLISGLIGALHPYLFWFTSRIYVEVLAIFLFTLVISSLTFFYQKNTFFRALLVGIVLGLSALTKTTFLIFIVFIPPFLFFSKEIIRHRKQRVFYAISIFLCSILIILPWTVRNWHLVHTVIPVQVLVGYNLLIGDGFVEVFNDDLAKGNNPLRSKNIWEESYESNIKPIEKEIEKQHPEKRLAEKELELDKMAIKQSFQHYIEDPLFFLKKLSFNAFAFWFLGPTLHRTFYLFLLEAPLLILFIIKSYQVLKYTSLLSLQSLHIFLVWLYFISHLPILAGGRFSVVLIPTMIVYALSLFKNFRERTVKT
jgi:4-amino-4-deoxy-L-arabinose transferase-like glycosyltransferase